MTSSLKDPTYYLEKAPVPKAILYMAIPMILGMMVNLIYCLTDTFYIGQLKDTSMIAAVTLAMPFMTLLMAFGNLIGTGTSTYVSRLLGAKKIKNAKRASAVGFYLSLLAGGLLIAFCVPLLETILPFLGASKDTLLYTHDYVLALMIGSPFMIANFAMEQIVRSEGAAAVSMKGMMLSVGVNMILDPIFIFGFGLNVLGAAIATVISSAVAVFYYVYYLNKKSKVQSVRLKDCKPNKKILSEIFKVGVSAFLLDAFPIASGLIFNRLAMSYGESVIAAFGIAHHIIHMSEFIAIGFLMGVVPLMAYSYAAKNKERLNLVVKTSALWLSGILISMGVLIYILKLPLLGLFSIDLSVLKTGEQILTALLIATFFVGCAGFFTSLFQAEGKGIAATIMSIARGAAFIPIVIVLSRMFALDGLIWSLAFSEAIACIIGALMYWKNKSKEIPANTSNSDGIVTAYPA